MLLLLLENSVFISLILLACCFSVLRLQRCLLRIDDEETNDIVDGIQKENVGGDGDGDGDDSSDEDWEKTQTSVKNMMPNV